MEVSEIVWEGTSFTAKVTLPSLGVYKLAGTTDAGARAITLTMTGPDGRSDFMAGSLVE